MSRFLDMNGNPMTIEEWGRAFQNQEARRLGSTRVGRFWISTVWLGMDYSYGIGTPLIFETMIFDEHDGESKCDLDQWQDRYATREEAVEGHNRAVELCRDYMKLGEHDVDLTT